MPRSIGAAQQVKIRQTHRVRALGRSQLVWCVVQLPGSLLLYFGYAQEVWLISTTRLAVRTFWIRYLADTARTLDHHLLGSSLEDNVADRRNNLPLHRCQQPRCWLSLDEEIAYRKRLLSRTIDGFQHHTARACFVVLMPANLVDCLHRNRAGLGYPRDSDRDCDCASACDAA